MGHGEESYVGYASIFDLQPSMQIVDLEDQDVVWKCGTRQCDLEGCREVGEHWKSSA